MPISGLVITLAGSSEMYAESIARLKEDPRLDVGAPVGPCLPVVAETRTLAEGETLVTELSRRSDVVFVDVVSVDFSDDAPEHPHGGDDGPT